MMDNFGGVLKDEVSSVYTVAGLLFYFRTIVWVNSLYLY